MPAMARQSHESCIADKGRLLSLHEGKNEPATVFTLTPAVTSAALAFPKRWPPAINFSDERVIPPHPVQSCKRYKLCVGLRAEIRRKVLRAP
mmetsp:Transcript_18687/g.39597  ORF Transcript_18687/g.39597 Transcript_18687/m.39597 type:complete len:92 (-) Transcript_18687:20-295(-)|eukprot:6212517-Pleurochrysis_carterae.AAC.4